MFAYETYRSRQIDAPMYAQTKIYSYPDTRRNIASICAT